jgi:small-conductance mechanosensitive channel
MPTAARDALIVIGSILFGEVALEVVVRLLRQLIAKRKGALEHSLLARLARPTRLLVGVVAFEVSTARLDLGQPLQADLGHLAIVVGILAVAWVATRATFVAEDLILSRYRIDTADNLHARRVHTQVQVLRRLVVAMIVFLALALSLLTFSAVRAAGAGLLASAGLIGIVAGLAARPAVTNLLAGIQIALTQPVRVDDVVVIEGHWGRVEEINLTYVVVAIWDQRRLILPIEYLISNPFENWTHKGADILGWVHVEVDYRAPVDELRGVLHDILSASPDWDGKVWTLQVTGATATTLQLRALMSSSDSSKSWNLQCDVREKLIAYLRSHHPDCLPRTRAEASAPTEADVASPTITLKAG